MPLFDLARIAAAQLVARIDYHESIGSTSDRALALAAEGGTDFPLLVLADEQTAGRGRGANRWWTSQGALTFSLLLEAPIDRLPPQRWPQVALAAGLAVCEALEGACPSAAMRLKWPNDVYLAGRKVCGILSESAPGYRDRLVVGIGINVNNTTHRSPLTTHHSLPSIAASLIDHDGVERDLTSVLVAVLDAFDFRWQTLLNDAFPAIATEYRRRCILTGKTVTIEQPGGQSTIGRCLGIDDSGALRLQTSRGETVVLSGTVSAWDA